MTRLEEHSEGARIGQRPLLPVSDNPMKERRAMMAVEALLEFTGANSLRSLRSPELTSGRTSFMGCK